VFQNNQFGFFLCVAGGAKKFEGTPGWKKSAAISGAVREAEQRISWHDRPHHRHLVFWVRDSE
jgi:hypothetical protein